MTLAPAPHFSLVTTASAAVRRCARLLAAGLGLRALLEHDPSAGTLGLGNGAVLSALGLARGARIAALGLGLAALGALGRLGQALLRRLLVGIWVLAFLELEDDRTAHDA